MEELRMLLHSSAFLFNIWFIYDFGNNQPAHGFILYMYIYDKAKNHPGIAFKRMIMIRRLIYLIFIGARIIHFYQNVL